MGELEQGWSDCPRPAPHHPLVLGAVVAVAGGSALDAARAAANSCVSVAGSASLRLLGLDPYEVHALNHQLVAAIERISHRARDEAHADDDLMGAARMLPAASTPAMDVLAEFHLQQEVRLFAS